MSVDHDEQLHSAMANMSVESKSLYSSASVHPLRGSSIDIHPNARWQQNGLTVAGGNEEGNGINQLSNPHVLSGSSSP
ncbi:unnamed protein product [Didymodactylos carnosus]|uniref:Uncharacterized protein n=1 Tax=Didymodactylos carnosus TaxID=1234261 RepID=A0A8S2RK02_9BILA|nr:unnamed protein product [Didymodactylos carnosus]CAF4155418.1 unnamed protein product [Didymodactylos carnosus]